MTQSASDAYILLSQIQAAYQAILADNLIGLYVHGSLAMDCFIWDHSDIDFLVIVKAEPSLTQKEALIRTLLRLNPSAPKKGFEMSVMLQADCQHFQHPAPYCLHYSNAHLDRCRSDLTAYCRSMKGLDPDLAAHITILRHTGKVLCGPPIQETFAPIPPAAYWDSIWLDVQNAKSDIIEQPVYIILNLCRVLAYAQEGLILSKAQGGFWGQSHLPECHQPLARAARNVYIGSAAPAFCENDLLRFADFCLTQIEAASCSAKSAMRSDAPERMQDR